MAAKCCEEVIVGETSTPPAVAIFATQLILALLTMISLITIATLPLGLDEAYYWYWSRHPDLSYLDHPPMVAWLMALGTAVGGKAVFFVRIGGFLLSLMGAGFAFAMVRELLPKAKKDLGWQYLLLLQLTLLVPGAFIIQTPDTPLYAFWQMALYFGAKVITKQQASAWYGMGLALGLGLLSKYTMALLVPGMLLVLLWCPTQRHWFGRKEPWLAALLALFIWSPVLLWNSQQQWRSFSFQLQQGLAATEFMLPLENLIEYIGGQAAAVSPWLWLAWIWYSLRGLFRRLHDSVYMYLTMLSWPIVLFFAWTSINSALAEANWPAPAYFAGILLALAVAQEQFGKLTRLRGVGMAMICFSLVFNLSVRIHLLYPWLPVSPLIDRRQDFANWSQLGQQIRQAMDSYPHNADWFIMADRGTILAEALYHSDRDLLGVDPFKPERYAFLGDFNEQLRGRNAIVIAKTYSITTPQLPRFFKNWTFLTTYKHEYRDRIISRHGYELYLGEDFLGNVAMPESTP